MNKSEKIKKKICLLGTGYVLKRLAEKLDPSNVILTSRDANKLAEFGKQGFTILSFDLSDSKTVDNLINNYDFDILIDSVPPVINSQPGHREFVQQLAIAKPELKVVYTSTTGVYGVTDGSIVTEDTPLNPLSSKASDRVMVEQLYRDNFTNHLILRLPAISGPERNPKNSFLSGHYPYIDNGKRHTNRIHVSDLVNLLQKIINSDFKKLPEVLNVTDGTNLTTKELLKKLQEQYPEIPEPQSISREEAKRQGYMTLLSDQKVSNQLMLETFGDIIKYQGTSWM